MSGLMIHCGGAHRTPEELAALPVPLPMGPRHHPLPFADIRTAVISAFDSAGVVEEAWATAKGDKHLFGLITLAGDNTKRAVAVGVRASTDKTLPLALAVGSNVFVCDNLAFNAEYRVGTRFTHKIEERLPTLMTVARNFLEPYGENIEAMEEKWSGEALRDWAAERYMIALVRTGVLPVTYLVHVLKEFDAPTHAEQRGAAGTKLGLWNALSHALRHGRAGGRALTTTMALTINARSMLDHPIDTIAEWEAPRMRNVKMVEESGRVIDVDDITEGAA